MRTFLYIAISFFLTGSLLPACRQQDERQKLSPEEFSEQQKLVERANRYLVKQDKELIESFASRRGWDMEITETGLYYQIYEKGNGPATAIGKDILMHYDISLLDGTPCYSSKEGGPKRVRIGRDQEESGLVQGMLLMRQGDKARFILPPHMAYGLLGDENKIPPRSVIVYELELLEVSD